MSEHSQQQKMDGKPKIIKAKNLVLILSINLSLFYLVNPFHDSKFDSIAEDDETVAEPEIPADPISSMCQQLSQELSMLSSKEEQEVDK